MAAGLDGSIRSTAAGAEQRQSCCCCCCCPPPSAAPTVMAAGFIDPSTSAAAAAAAAVAAADSHLATLCDGAWQLRPVGPVARSQSCLPPGYRAMQLWPAGWGHPAAAAAPTLQLLLLLPSLLLLAHISPHSVMVQGSFGRLAGPVATFSILRTTSSPSLITRPKTTCLLSSQSAKWHKSRSNMSFLQHNSPSFITRPNTLCLLSKQSAGVA
jgi:hypothetical protein